MYMNMTRKCIVIWSFCILILVLLITVIAFKVNIITLGKRVILDDGDINISSYYAEYDATVISNKNTNTYLVKEWYKEGVGSKIEYFDYMDNIVTVINTPLGLYIGNNGNKSDMLNENVYERENVLSLATYLNIFNGDITCSCKKSVYKKNEEINLIYSVCNKDNCMQSNNLKHMGITNFDLNIKDNIPITYTVYTENKKEYACVVYSKFDVNILLEDEIFNISK